MISASDRRQTVKLIDQACARGAAREKACKEMGISALISAGPAEKEDNLIRSPD